MKRWRKYALCLACVCCMALLTGCGNDDNNAKETERGGVTTEKNTSDRNGAKNDRNDADNQKDGTVPDDGGAGDEMSGGAADGNVNDATDENAAENGNTDGRTDGAAENDGDGSVGENIGDAGRDIVNGVGDAGKDVIDGVEDAGDALTGNDTDQNNENN